jgi:hypothetical protein
MVMAQRGASSEELQAFFASFAADPKRAYELGRLFEQDGQHELAEQWMRIAALGELPE